MDVSASKIKVASRLAARLSKMRAVRDLPTQQHRKADVSDGRQEGMFERVQCRSVMARVIWVYVRTNCCRVI